MKKDLPSPKKSDRIAAEGVVDILKSDDGLTTAIVEVNSETDFVANNATFREFVKGILRTILAGRPANVEALLAEAGASAADLAQMIVYLRDPADYPAVRKIFELRYEAVPRLFVHAPVCRPGWLIETECIAVREDENPAFAPL